MIYHFFNSNKYQIKSIWKYSKLWYDNKKKEVIYEKMEIMDNIYVINVI